MIEEIADGVDAAETAARAIEASRQAQFTHAMQQAHGGPHEAPHDPPRPASDHHAGGLAGLWDDAVSGVGSAYHWTTGAAHAVGHAADDLAGKAIDAGTGMVRKVAGNDVANVVHGAAETLRNGVKQAAGFDLGVAEGATDAVGGMMKGVGNLAGDGYKFATDGAFRGRVVQGAEALGSHVVHDPLGTATALGQAAFDAGKNWVGGAETAARNGDLGEYVGKGLGNAAVNIGGFFIPGADVVDGLNVAGKVGETGEVLNDADKLGDLGRAAEMTDAAHAAGETKPVEITLRGVEHTIPDWHMQEISYTKRADAAREALRSDFPTVRRGFVKDLAANHASELRDAGMSPSDIAMMEKGRIPEGYQVHHMLPLDDGGTNATNNLVLIRNEPDHKLITRYQIEHTQGMSAGETRRMDWPMPDRNINVWPETPDGGAYPTRH